MWPEPEPELRAIIRPEPEMKNRSLHSTSSPFCYVLHDLLFIKFIIISFLSRMRDWTVAEHSTVNLLVKVQYIWLYNKYSIFGCITTSRMLSYLNYDLAKAFWVFSRELTNQLNRFKKSTRANSRSSANRYSNSRKCTVKQIILLWCWTSLGGR
jgi:hypothetical protein